METVDVLQGLKEEGTVLINATHGTDVGGYRTYSIDLTGIALRENLVVAGSPILNTPVLGALAKMGIVSVESVTSAISEMFSDERNVKAARAAFQELVI